MSKSLFLISDPYVQNSSLPSQGSVSSSAVVLPTHLGGLAIRSFEMLQAQALALLLPTLLGQVMDPNGTTVCNTKTMF